MTVNTAALFLMRGVFLLTPGFTASEMLVLFFAFPADVSLILSIIRSSFQPFAISVTYSVRHDHADVYCLISSIRIS